MRRGISKNIGEWTKAIDDNESIWYFLTVYKYDSVLTKPTLSAVIY